MPRCYSQRAWKDSQRVELLAFSDASPKGYGAAIYIRVPLDDGSFHVSLVMAKSRVSPLKKLTLPRLELLGCLVAARLVVFVRRALRLPEDTPISCWTDSMIALGWIRANPLKWKQFVSNRVTEIQSLTSPASWYHCAGVDNPADLTTRGVSAEELLGSDLWLSGPRWLSSPTGQPTAAGEPVAPELPREEAAVLTAATPAQGPFDFERWSSFSKAVRVVAWVRRFIRNIKTPGAGARGPRTRQTAAKRRQLELDPDEIVQARRQLLVVTLVVTSAG